jgi:hypothetical protein
MAAAQLRVHQAKLKNIPAAVKGESLFVPGSQTRTVSAVTVRDVLKSGQTYTVEIPYNAPGIFVARSMVVNTTFKLPVTDAGAGQLYSLWRNMAPGAPSGLVVNLSDYYGTALSTGGIMTAAPFSYVWTLEDPRSGKQIADDFMSMYAILPPPPDVTDFVPGSRLLFDAPLVLERDSQLNFLIRPTTDVVQSAVTAGDLTVKIRVELHGTRYFTEQDALRKGARIP